MKKPRIQVTITSTELTEATREEMWKLYRKYYHYSRESFMQRISLNNYFSFYTVDGRIAGFTGLRINRTEVDNRQCLLIYFGQTIIGQEYRGNSLIHRTATKLCLQYWKDIVLGRVFVWADALTYKPYLAFAKTVTEYYPSYRTITPDYIQQLINFVGEEYYGETFCPETGTVKKDKIFVNDPTTLIDPMTERDLDVLFYLAINPKYTLGHGLITLTPMHGKNYLKVVFKCLKKIFFRKKKRECVEWAMQAN
ncbi:MAG: hypothetical protein DHS20C18_38030 [Saprospiraceae bacterium]|nr:MAG: hypothetical protein DHS20C18_38030 [Saprospiraceae bacterium]